MISVLSNNSIIHVYNGTCTELHALPSTSTPTSVNSGMQLFIVVCYRRLHCGFLLGEGTGSAYGVVLVLDSVPKTNYAVV